MMIDAQGFPTVSKLKSHISIVEMGITTVNSAVMVRAKKNHILSGIFSSSAQPMNVEAERKKDDSCVVSLHCKRREYGTGDLVTKREAD